MGPVHTYHGQLCQNRTCMRSPKGCVTKWTWTASCMTSANLRCFGEAKLNPLRVMCPQIKVKLLCSAKIMSAENAKIFQVSACIPKFCYRRPCMMSNQFQHCLSVLLGKQVISHTRCSQCASFLIFFPQECIHIYGKGGSSCLATLSVQV